MSGSSAEMTKISREEPLWKRTTFRIGGPARTLAQPESMEDLRALIRQEDVHLILGGGANLLVSDAGVEGMVLALGPEFARVEISAAGRGVFRVKAGASMRLSRLAGMMMKRSLSGLEFGFGIPGLLGGALRMNAGARGGEMKDIVESIDIVTKDGALETVLASGAGFGYRSSRFPEGCVITGATLTLREGSGEAIHSAMREGYALRRAAQPLDMPSAGSVYKNPPGDYAGRLVEVCGLKGERTGDAMVSPKHANFIVNLGAARAGDVRRLMRLVEKRVYEQTGVKLEREIRLAGEFDEE